MKVPVVEEFDALLDTAELAAAELAAGEYTALGVVAAAVAAAELWTLFKLEVERPLFTKDEECGLVEDGLVFALVLAEGVFTVALLVVLLCELYVFGLLEDRVAVFLLLIVFFVTVDFFVAPVFVVDEDTCL